MVLQEQQMLHYNKLIRKVQDLLEILKYCQAPYFMTSQCSSWNTAHSFIITFFQVYFNIQ